MATVTVMTAGGPITPGPAKPDDAKPAGTGDAIDGLPPGINARSGALAAAGCFMLLGIVLLAWAMLSKQQRGRIQLQVPLTFGGRGYGWEASRPLGLLASGAVCFLLAVLLLLQLLNSARGKPDAPKTAIAAPAPAGKASGS